MAAYDRFHCIHFVIMEALFGANSDKHHGAKTATSTKRNDDKSDKKIL